MPRVRNLRARLPATTTQDGRPVDWAALPKIIGDLEALLQDDDVRSLDALRRHAADLDAALGPASIALRHAVEGFDFELALGILRAATAAEPRLVDVIEA